MLSQINIKTIVGLLCNTRPTLGFDIKFVLVHLVLYGMVGNVALLCIHKGNIIQSWLYGNEGSD